MLVAALTGNIASGKSTVADRLRTLGATVIDADALAREAVAPGSPALGAIVGRWGDAMRHPDGTLDRAALRRVAFADPAERAALEAIVHPRVEALRAQAVAAARAAGAAVVVCDIPLLFETGGAGRFDCVIVVHAAPATRRARLRARPGLDPQDAERMMAAQRPTAQTRGAADHVLENDGTREALLAQVDALWPVLVARAAAG